MQNLKKAKTFDYEISQNNKVVIIEITIKLCIYR